jgi:hypothetical protein
MLVRQTELDADTAHLVLEQLAQRFDQLEFQIGGQTTDVVMRLDHVRLAGLARRRLDDIGIDRALRQESGPRAACVLPARTPR